MNNFEDIWALATSSSIEDNIKCILLSKTPREVIRYFRNSKNAKILKTLITRNDIFNIDELTLLNRKIKKANIEENVKNIERLTNFCPIPWTHIEIATNGTYRACCQMVKKPFGVVKTKNTIHGIDSLPLSKVLNSDIHKDLRLQFLQNEKHVSCNLCWKEEENKVNSKRQWELYQAKNKNLIKDIIDNTNLDTGELYNPSKHLQYLDLRLGNKCNLKCTSCGPTESNLWYNDAYETGYRKINYFGTDQIYNLTKENNKVVIDTDDFNWPSSSTFLSQFKKLNLDRLYFTGGEPSINHEHYKILSYLIKENKAKNITLEYNTNGTAISNKFLSHIKMFKKIYLTLSIDEMFNRFHYLRYPGKWASIEQSVKLLKQYTKEVKNITIKVAPTISIFNVNNIIMLQEWSNINFGDSVTMHFLEGPEWMNIGLLTKNSREQLIKMYNLYINQSSNNDVKQAFTGLCNTIESAKYIDKEIFYKKVKLIDSVRKVSYKDYFDNEIDNLIQG